MMEYHQPNCDFRILVSGNPVQYLLSWSKTLTGLPKFSLSRSRLSRASLGSDCSILLTEGRASNSCLSASFLFGFHPHQHGNDFQTRRTVWEESHSRFSKTSGSVGPGTNCFDGKNLAEGLGSPRQQEGCHPAVVATRVDALLDVSCETWAGVETGLANAQELNDLTDQNTNRCCMTVVMFWFSCFAQQLPE